MYSLFRKFLVNNKGLALVEFTIFAPLLLTVFLGMVELSRYIIIMQKVERTTYSLSSVVAQYLPAGTIDADPLNMISADNMTTNVFPQALQMMTPYNDADNFRTIVTSVSNTGANKIINWQVASPNASGKLTNSDTVSIVNGLSSLSISPAVQNSVATFNFDSDILASLSTMQLNENMIVVEVFYNYQPLVSDILTRVGADVLAQRTIISRIYTMPRQGKLLTLPPLFN